ncbi:N-acetylglucosamine repressor [Nocardioides aquaticus]|uniref:N-acetylglucosamine repressor n=2 Tax=Nocardioides aquaticus TaxID=160826 RepID=A0ABX8EDH9_9ACTN|nr:N-acetylglucosamine repressor [Nocardioides aquaticus]
MVTMTLSPKSALEHEVRRARDAGSTTGELLRLVRTGRASTRADLGRLTGLSRTAVASRLAALGAAGLLRAGDELASTGGRPPTELVFDTGFGVVLTAALGRSRTQLGVFDLAANALATSSREHPAGVGPAELMPAVAAGLRDLLAGLDHRPRRVVGIGVSLPGTVDGVRGASVDSPVMSGWDGVELAPYLADVVPPGLTDDDVPPPLFLGNDADALARSERMGRTGALEDVLVVKASTGLGLGIVAGGQVLTGHLGAAGEIGHTAVDAGGERTCRCGATGCLETVAGGWALVARMNEQGRAVTHVREVVDLALAGDGEARHLLRESGRHLGDLLAVAINLLNPQAVVLGGDMPVVFDIYSAGVRESVYARAAALATRDLQILPATFGDRAGLVGCAATVLDHVLSPASVDAFLAHAPR